MPGVDVPAVVQSQRTQTMRSLRDLTRLKLRATEQDDLAWLLVLDNLVFSAEAEVRWLDHVEARLTRRAHTPDGRHHRLDDHGPAPTDAASRPHDRPSNRR